MAGVSEKPVWLLDIDGVINATVGWKGKPPTQVWAASNWIDTVAADAIQFRILSARPVIEFVKLVHETGRAEIRWHTTWQHSAQNVADALGLRRVGG